MNTYIVTILSFCVLVSGCGPEPEAATEPGPAPLPSAGVPCVSPADCPGGADFSCARKTCVAGRCDVELAPAGTPATLLGQDYVDTEPGDCKRRVCDGRGRTTLVADDLDVGVEVNQCMRARCEDGALFRSPKSSSSACWGPDPCCLGRCDGAGACLRGTCIGTEEECEPDPEPLPPGEVDVCDTSATREAVCRFEPHGS